MTPILGFIPSPAHGIVHIGPLPLHAYGLMLALGVLASAKIAERRWARGGHDPADIGAIAVPVVIAGVIGARAYHLFTGYDWSSGGIIGTVKIWNGGLSIWGAVIGGLFALVFVARRRRLDLVALMDAIAPAVLIGQAIGRFGNYFNQELFGRPTTLPWGLEIDLAHRPAGYTQYATFHPTFLYESLWCLLVFGRSSSPNAESGFAKDRRSRCTCACTRWAELNSKRSASTKRRASSASDSTSCSRPRSASVARCVSFGSHDDLSTIAIDQTRRRSVRTPHADVNCSDRYGGAHVSDRGVRRHRVPVHARGLAAAE